MYRSEVYKNKNSDFLFIYLLKMVILGDRIIDGWIVQSKHAASNEKAEIERGTI